MGRLFWKFFAFVWLAQLAVMVALGVLFWIGDQSREAARPPQLAAGPMAADEVRAAASVLQYAGLAGFQSWSRATQGPRVLAVDDAGGEALRRSIPRDALEQLRELQAEPQAAPQIASVTAPDGRHYTLFSISPNRRGGGRPPGPPGPPGPQGPRPPPRYAWMRTLPSPGALCGALAGSVLTALLLALYVAKPIRSLRRAFEAAAAGNLDRRVSSDIGHRKDELADLGRDFDRMAERLRASMEGQRRLLHDVSHELRSPLARVQAAVGLLREEPARLAAMTERIDIEVARIDHLVGELLTLSRLEAGELGTRQQEVDLHELVADVIEGVQFEAGGCVITWKQGEQVTVWGEPQLLHSAIENIVRNALKHAGTDTIHIETGRTADLRHYRLRVLDEGRGLSIIELERLFTPFFRGSATAGTGYGLGLAIARRSVEAHGGTINAANRESGGLCVEIVLPCRENQPGGGAPRP